MYFILAGLPIAVILDICLRSRQKPTRGRHIASSVMSWSLRTAAIFPFLLILAALFVASQMSERPAPPSKQGPDTEDARHALSALVGNDASGAFRQAYFFREPTFVGGSEEYLRFDFPYEAKLLELFASKHPLAPAAAGECAAPYGGTPPKWWLPTGTQIESSYKWDGIHRICIDETHRRAFIRRIGH